MADEKNIQEDVALINTFLNVNTVTPSQTQQNKTSGILKTITNRLLNPNVISDIVLNYKSGSKKRLDDVIDIKSGRIIQENLSDFRNMSTSRYLQYAAYEEMANDPIISAALDMYADDATQTDASNNRIWISSSDTDTEKIVSSIFNKINISDSIWRIARLLAEYGDVYIELLYDDEETSQVRLTEGIKKILEDGGINLKLINSKGHLLNDIRIISDVENMFDLQLNGRTVAFARLNNTSSQFNRESNAFGYIDRKYSMDDVSYYPADKFVHLYIDQSDKRYAEYFDAEMDDGNAIRFEVARGKSMIHDLYSTWRDLQLLEYSIMLNRASKSTIFRFVQVEVGNMSKSNVDVTLRKVKNLIESKITMNTQDNTYKPYNEPGPIENYVYIPTRNGQGNISVDTVGGDVNIRDLADLEYYQNKLFSGLKIPKEFLNYGEGNALFNSGAALTKLDARYARTVKRLQNFIIRGINHLVDNFLSNRGLNQYDEYEVRMVVPSTVEDNDRIETFSQKIQLMNDLTSALSGLSESDDVSLDVEKYVEYLADKVFGESFLKDVIKVNSTSDTDMSDIEAGESSGGGFDNDFGGGGGGFESPSFEPEEPSGGISFENTPTTTETSPIETTVEPSSGGGVEAFSGEWEEL